MGEELKPRIEALDRPGSGPRIEVHGRPRATSLNFVTVPTVNCCDLQVFPDS